MNFQQNQAITARPNVLSDQMLPNTLGGVSDPGSVVGRRLPQVAPLAVGAVIVAAVVAALLVISAGIG